MKKGFIFIVMLSFFNLFGQNNANQYFEKSKKLTDEKDFEKALIFINRALKFDKLNRVYLLQKVKILYFKSDCKEGLIELNKLFEKENKIDDETISYFCDLADCINESDEATVILTDYVEKKKYKSDEIIAKLAQRFFLQKKYEKSIYFYNEFIKLHPKDTDAIIDLARILYSYKSSEDAINEIKKGLEININNVELLICLSNFYFSNKEYEKSLNILNEVIKLNYDVKHIATRAMLYEKLQKLDKAYEDNKTVTVLLKCKSDYYYSKILQYEYDNKLFEEVVKHSLELIECNKSYENSVIDGLYTSLFFCGDFEKGKVYLDKKLAVNPDNFNPYYLKSIVLFNEKQNDDVLKNLDLASKTKDVTPNDLTNISFLKFSYFLIKEDYDGLIAFWKSGTIIALDNKMNFTFIEGKMNEKTDLKTVFDKKTGVITSTLTIPTKELKLLKKKYGLKIEINNPH